MQQLHNSMYVMSVKKLPLEEIPQQWWEQNPFLEEAVGQALKEMHLYRHHI